MCGNVTFHDYKEGDVFLLDIRSGDMLGRPPVDQPFPAWTMKADGEVVACGGVVNAGGGVGLLWMYIADAARGHGFALARFSRKALNRLFEVMKFHRIQTVIRTDRPEYVRWALLFGFEKEAVLRKATPSQEDLFLFARII